MQLLGDPQPFLAGLPAAVLLGRVLAARPARHGPADPRRSARSRTRTASAIASASTSQTATWTEHGPARVARRPARPARQMRTSRYTAARPAQVSTAVPGPEGAEDRDQRGQESGPVRVTEHDVRDRGRDGVTVDAASASAAAAAAPPGRQPAADSRVRSSSRAPPTRGAPGCPAPGPGSTRRRRTTGGEPCRRAASAGCPAASPGHRARHGGPDGHRPPPDHRSPPSHRDRRGPRRDASAPGPGARPVPGGMGHRVSSHRNGRSAAAGGHRLPGAGPATTRGRSAGGRRTAGRSPGASAAAGAVPGEPSAGRRRPVVRRRRLMTRAENAGRKQCRPINGDRTGYVRPTPNARSRQDPAYRGDRGAARPSRRARSGWPRCTPRSTATNGAAHHRPARRRPTRAGGQPGGVRRTSQGGTPAHRRRRRRRRGTGRVVGAVRVALLLAADPDDVHLVRRDAAPRWRRWLLWGGRPGFSRGRGGPGWGGLRLGRPERGTVPAGAAPVAADRRLGWARLVGLGSQRPTAPARTAADQDESGPGWGRGGPPWRRRGAAESGRAGSGWRGRADRPRYPDLAGRVAVVTGGSRGIGAGHRRYLAGDGMRVALVGRDTDALARGRGDPLELADARSRWPPTAPTRPRSRTLRDRVEREFGQVDVLAAFAGGAGAPKPTPRCPSRTGGTPSTPT